MRRFDHVSAQPLIIFNPRSGGGSRIGRDGLVRALEDAGLEHDLVAPDGALVAEEVARAAARKGRTVVAAGGDGTIHVVANGVLAAGPEVPAMGVLPLGSGNDFARALGRVGRGLASAVRALVDPRVIAIDVGRVNGGEWFVNGIGVGFDAEVVHRLRGSPAGPLGYFPTIARTILSYRPQRYRVSWATGELDASGLMLAAMNGQSEGGGFRLTPDARLDDGLLDVCWVDPIGLLQFVRYVLRVRRGTHSGLPMVTSFRADGLRVECEGPLSYHLDGEYREQVGGESLEIELVPKRLRMIT